MTYPQETDNLCLVQDAHMEPPTSVDVIIRNDNFSENKANERSTIFNRTPGKGFGQYAYPNAMEMDNRSKISWWKIH